MRADPVLDRIAQRGLEHEQRFLAELNRDGLRVVEIPRDETLPPAERLMRGREATIAAMREGADVIYQAVLFEGRCLGYADFLRRVEQPSDLGPWRYEVWDTKLARHAKASAVLQLAMYSELLEAVQGQAPRFLCPRNRSRSSTATSVVGAPSAAQWRTEDDLSLVANLTSVQRHALHVIGVTTRSGLAEPATPLPDRIPDAGREALAHIRAQAEIQVRGEREGRVIAERIPPARDREGGFVPNNGLLMLPEPSPGDLFFDIEGDPFFGSDEVDGIDYLFGVIEPGRAGPDGQPAFHAFWSVEGGTVTTAGERAAFEAFIDLVTDRLRADPNLHVYHYAPYEPTAVKRLAGRYGTREEDVDRLLRGGVFVDLYRAVRQGIRASVESYSIKRLEPLYGFEREVDLRDAGTSIVEFETWLELNQEEERNDLRAQIAGYNRDDCVSTLRLRDWLEEQRAALAAELGDLPRPTVPEPEQVEDTRRNRR